MFRGQIPHWGRWRRVDEGGASSTLIMLLLFVLWSKDVVWSCVLNVVENVAWVGSVVAAASV